MPALKADPRPAMARLILDDICLAVTREAFEPLEVEDDFTLEQTFVKPRRLQTGILTGVSLVPVKPGPCLITVVPRGRKAPVATAFYVRIPTVADCPSHIVMLKELMDLKQ